MKPDSFLIYAESSMWSHSESVGVGVAGLGDVGNGLAKALPSTPRAPQNHLWPKPFVLVQEASDTSWHR